MKPLTKKLLFAEFSILVLVATAYLTYGYNPFKKQPYNVILISLDTLRSDRLGSYGYSRDTSPTLDSLAQKGAVFLNHIAESNWTLPSHVTMLSGLHPASHRIHDKNLSISPKLRMSASLFKHKGYKTYGFTDGGYVAKTFGFAQGFDKFNDHAKGFADRITNAQDALDHHPTDRPFFLFLHTYDVHCPYNPPEPYHTMFNTPGAQQIDPKGCGVSDYNKRTTTPAQAQYLSDRYDGSIRWMDTNLNEFMNYLESRDLLKNTIIAITSDHGESFMEHGLIGHQRSLHREVIFIPLIIVGPGVPNIRINEPTGLMDVVPTLLDLAQLPVPQVFDGSSLTALFDGTGSEEFLHRPRISMLRRRRTSLTSYVSLPLHLIDKPQAKKKELFDLIRDPLEANDLSNEQPQITAELTEHMHAELKRFKQKNQANVSELSAPDDEKVKELKSLGYIN